MTFSTSRRVSRVNADSLTTIIDGDSNKSYRALELRLFSRDSGKYDICLLINIAWYVVINVLR